MPVDLGVLVRQLQGALGGRRVLSGGVTDVGAVNYGAGFSVARTGTGVYAVTFDRPFKASYALTFGSDQGVALPRSYWSAQSLSGFTASIKDSSGVLTDAFWNFTAVG